MTNICNNQITLSTAHTTVLIVLCHCWW